MLGSRTAAPRRDACVRVTEAVFYAHMTTVPFRRRLQISIALGLLAGLRAYLVAARTGKTRDFDQVWFAARSLLAHVDPYTVIGPGRAFDYEFFLFYPLTAAVAAVPLAPLSAAAASMVFIFVAGGCFAWVLMEHGYEPLLGYMGAGMVFAAEVVQWSPLFAAAVLLPPLGFFFAAKPTIGAAMFAARPSWWPIVGGLVLGGIAFAVQPHWLESWRAVLAVPRPTPGAAAPYNLPLLLPGGFVVLAAITRWRRPEARIVLALACVPQTTLLYETVPLFLIPRTLKESALLVGLSYLVPAWVGYVTSASQLAPIYIGTSGRAITILLYIPATIMVLRRPNEGELPAWLERAVSGWPAWLRGRAPSPSVSTTTPSPTVPSNPWAPSLQAP